MIIFLKYGRNLALLVLLFSSCLSIKPRRYNSGLSIDFKNTSPNAIEVTSYKNDGGTCNKSVTGFAYQQTYISQSLVSKFPDTSGFQGDTFFLIHYPENPSYNPILQRSSHNKNVIQVLAKTTFSKKENLPVEPLGLISFLIIIISIILLSLLLFAFFNIFPVIFSINVLILIICWLLASWVPALVFALISLKKHNSKPKQYTGKEIPKMALILTLLYTFILSLLTTLFLIFGKIY